MTHVYEPLDLLNDETRTCDLCAVGEEAAMKAAPVIRLDSDLLCLFPSMTALRAVAMSKHSTQIVSQLYKHDTDLSR